MQRRGRQEGHRLGRGADSARANGGGAVSARSAPGPACHLICLITTKIMNIAIMKSTLVAIFAGNDENFIIKKSLLAFVKYDKVNLLQDL